MPNIKLKSMTDTPAQPSQWKKILSASTISAQDLLIRLELDEHPLLDQNAPSFPLRVPEPFLNKIEKGNPNDPLLLQVLPQAQESLDIEGYASEPLLEQNFSPLPGLIHKYSSRVLLILTQSCAIHCRYCFRRNFPYSEHQQSRQQWQQALDYVATRSEISEVILSGGDPLSLSDSSLEELFDKIDRITSVKRIRIHTRMLPSLPQRITSRLLKVISNLRCKVILVAHCNHPNELANDTERAFLRLKEHGVTLLNQSVMLRHINDDAQILQALSEKLFAQGVLPYYLFTLDKVAGAAHFDLPRSEAKQIYKELCAQLPGFLTPKLAEEQPGDGSKRVLSNH
ncbi:hypothetical protein A3742_02955 [Oleiphilus sp. HI0071]|uniref:EF-P beta-lysylation protein EpmB n=2 Tax=unclassified Oleiphilus TaxID=2631174 RepID=UPI0007C2823B|nr:MULTISPECIES: EF-P beta-lysylation protein EpmB [unclassified Oleiphilus]KZY61065.1 hypothetical protein A3737_06265 [Oleiphilus sp. HI0065]KZY89721.1 hypothetical protein A3744_06105 [Oleiphilus sp. HI0073]KZY90273.1 hypothetical protein A3742_02955 [Oleiphilus sp. HI0071]KZZ44204.1 hypothetical protein A3758_19015 [Oleiphilus sp. HI0118]KZZ55842.1 hypothetical protein A3760_00585 [Oleiphilus sp. HI0122]KZZ68004.1 hypothetical protein A3765_00625 [Oleiphilus sp. HI0130]KZZ80542.1 hypothe